MREPDCTVDRTIEIPQRFIDRVARGPIAGRCLVVPVAVNWPELRLTEAQLLANAVALANGEREPYPDPSIFSIKLPWALPQERKI